MAYSKFEKGFLDTPEGKLGFFSARSGQLKQRVDTAYFIPPELEGAQNAPVIILLHGVYGGPWSWFLQGRVHQTMRQLIDQKKCLPAVIVCPSDGAWGDGSGYVAHHGKDFEKWIGEELIEILQAEFSCLGSQSPFYISGLSMGGFGALRLGLRYPIFQAISAHSSITSLEEMTLFTQDEWQSTIEKISEPSIKSLIPSSILKPIRFDCGRDDDLLAGNESLHEYLVDSQYPHQFQILEGGHTWAYWQENVARSFQFFSEQLLKRQ